MIKKTGLLQRLKNILPKNTYDIIFYVLFVLAIILKSLYFYDQLEVSIRHNPFHPAWTYCLVTAFVVSLPYFIFRKRLNLFIIIYFLLLDILLIANTSYYRYYANVIPIFSYGQIGNMTELNIFSYLKWKDMVYVLITLVTCLVYYIFKRRLKGFTKKQRIITPIAILVLSACIIGGDLYSSVRKNISLPDKFMAGKLYSTRLVSSYGLITLWIYQLNDYYNTCQSPLTEEEKRNIENFIAQKQSRSNSPIVTEKEPKNLILLIVESLSSWTLNYDNGKAAPFLHNLTHDSATIYVRNVIPQTLHSRSADAQLLYNTGLTPPFNSMIVTMHATQYYPSLAEALREKDNYYSLTMQGYHKQLWNQKMMNKAYNFDRLISIENLQADEIIGAGLSDASLYRQTVDIIKEQIPQPFYLQLISLSSHDGIDFANRPSDLYFPKELPEDVKNYIKAIEYVDSTIQKFIEDLKSNDLYDNSIIVIIGDHEGITTPAIQDYFPELAHETEKNTTFIPLFILNSGKSISIDSEAVVGAIDIYPTLLDLMGINQYHWKGLGESLFSDTPPVNATTIWMVPYGKKDISEDKIDYLKNMLVISDLIITKKYFEIQRK